MKKLFILSAIMLLHVFQMTYAREHENSSSASVYLVDFKFEKRDLKDILNEFAQLRGINILYSSTAQLNAKVTFDAGKKITFMKAWEFLLMMLEQAGFSLINQGKDMYALVGSDLVGTTPLPIYINSDADELPLTQERIRYIYYFKNISLTNQQNDLSTVLKNFFDSKSVNQQLIFDTNFNAMIITAKSEIIKAVMKFVDVFDQAGEKQVADVFDLQYASAAEVSKILTDLIAGQDAAKSKTAQKPTVDLNAVFSPGTRVISLFSNINSGYGSSSTAEYPNTLVILGKKTDVQQVKKFIQEHLDIPIEQGKSFFHVVELQWLSAQTLCTILQDLITPPGGSGQSTNVSLSNLAFDPQVKIVPESIAEGMSPSTDLSQPLASNGVSNKVQRGSNTIIIAATNKDWVRIEEVIKKLDIPQKQVVIEALILDLSLIFTHKLASQIRTNGLSSAIFPKSMQAQAAMLLPAIPSEMSTGIDTSGFDVLSPTGLEGDLSKLLEIIAPASSDDQSAASSFFMIGDKQNSNGIWAFFQLLALHASSKTISRAFVIAQNNMPATVTNQITKRLPGKLTAGVTATISYQTVGAPVTISFTPLISANDVVNLQIQVDATYWTDPTGPVSGTSNNREIQTNFSMKDGQVAILGGLTKNQIDVSFNGVPFFSKIPIIGPLFFSNKRHTEDKVKLFMIVRTTITKPRHQGGMGKVTRRMAAVTNHLLQESDDDDDLFSSIKDPISRWIFDEGETYRHTQSDMPLKDLFQRGDSTVNFL